MFDFIQSDTFWSAVSALATVIGAGAIAFAARDFHFSVWLKAQEIWRGPEFTKARGEVFARLDKPPQQWRPDETERALDVCRNMDEFARLAPYLGKRKMLAIWGDPLAKAWLVLKPLVEAERDKAHWKEKWDAFQALGDQALAERPHLRQALLVSKAGV